MTSRIKSTTAKLQALYTVRYLLGARRFLDRSLPGAKQRQIYDRVTRTVVNIAIRDDDDWIQIEHIFLNEGYNLEKTARQLPIATLYSRIIKSDAPPLIIDLGANIGLASKYFDIIYPNSRILAVEPDQGNCEIAQKNLPKTAVLHQAAIASRSGSGHLIPTGRNVGFRVESDPDGGVPLLTVQDLLDQAKGCAPFLIKIDIEGFESDLFSCNTDWIDLFPILLIELHDWILPGKTVTHYFLREMSRRNRDFMHFDGYVASIAGDLSRFTIL